MEQQDPMFEENTTDKAKAWIQENLRIIVSVFIVAAIALGIYSFSQRNQTLTDNNLLDTKGAQEQSAPTDQGDTNATATPQTGSGVVVTPELSRETETSFVEVAERGNGTTHLARRALANYLEKNPDSSLSAEHKIYIEDYLRKNAGFRGTLRAQQSVEFSKDLISRAIEKSKTLNARQLQNLKKYSAHVSAYR